MSIQDESFPYDDDLELSRNSGKNIVFPHFRRGTTVSSSLENNNPEVVENVNPSEKNISSSSSPIQNQDDSANSSNDFCPPSETSGKTNASEPNDLQESQNKKSEFKRHNTNKSISYQDIHSEYTKRRYKHVESKVGQYIANIKAQDEKRRNSVKFQRHRSMPETLHGTETASQLHQNDSNKHSILSQSTNDLDRIQDHHNTENYDNLTTTTSSLSTRDLASDAGGIVLDHQTYDQLINDRERKDYLETKLDMKNEENWRLKKNLDTMRIEYSLCKEKLKQQSLMQRNSGSFGSINATATLGRTCLQCLLYPKETKEKATQTDGLLTPSPVPPLNKAGNEMFATPLTPTSQNNSFDHAAVGMLAPVGQKISKSVATIQPLSLNFSNLVEQDNREFNSSNINTTIGFLRNRSNSIAARRKSTPLPVNTSRISSAGSSVPSSSDSAIDIEVAESPKSQRQSRREEFIYYEQRSQRFSILEACNADSENINNNNTGNSSNKISEKSTTGKRTNLRSRIRRIFGACTKCDDPNLSLESMDKRNHSQIPLLNKTTSINNCRTFR
ncbi:swallow [Cochliomyia hominivorax]